MPTDPKWRVIARKSGQPIALVIATYNFLMVNAAENATERGRTHGWNNEDVAAALDVSEQDIAAILDAMQGKVLEGQHLSGWEKRQPKREDSSAERAKRWRNERNRTQPNAEERPDIDADNTLDKSSVAAQRATRLPDGFIVPVEWIEWAQKEKSWPVDIVKVEADSFVDFWHAKSGRDATKKDWQATWRNWVRNSRRVNGARTKPRLMP